jgi:GTP-binding protein HflX
MIAEGISNWLDCGLRKAGPAILDIKTVFLYINQNKETMKDFIITEAQTEKAVLVGLMTPQQNDSKVDEYLDELAFLAETAGMTAVKRFKQRLDSPNRTTFVGSGKLQEIKSFLVESEADIVIFDDELSAKQLRNIEKELQVMILDRTSLILDIFARRAQTAYAKTQVELAKYQYMLPRLTRLWTHLERQSGGSRYLRGPGETQLETDRRIIQTKVAKLKRDLEEIDRQMITQRKNRGKMVRTALVGYTNVGKSTLMNILCKSEVFAEDKLFATLDTTVRKMIVGNLPFLLSDTVGFIRKLPTELVESFKSTLDEVREADLLLHIVDISHPGFEEQIEVVEKTLAEIGGGDKPVITIFNKVDAFTFVPKAEDDLTPRTKENASLEELEHTWMNKMGDNGIFISAKNLTNIDRLKNLLYERVKEIHISRYPYNDFLYQQYEEEC